MVGERRAQRLARIVVAGNHVDRHGSGASSRREMGVFLGLAAIDQIAGREHDVGPRIERSHMRHRPLEEARGVDAVVEELARRP